MPPGRIIGFFLIPCLLADPALSSALSRPVQLRAPATLPGLFHQQALAGRTLSGLHPIAGEPGAFALAWSDELQAWTHHHLTPPQHEVINYAWRIIWDRILPLPPEDPIYRDVAALLAVSRARPLIIHSPYEEMFIGALARALQLNPTTFPPHFRLISHAGTNRPGGTQSWNLLIPRRELQHLGYLRKSNPMAYNQWRQHEAGGHLLSRFNAPLGLEYSEAVAAALYSVDELVSAFNRFRNEVPGRHAQFLKQRLVADFGDPQKLKAGFRIAHDSALSPKHPAWMYVVEGAGAQFYVHLHLLQEKVGQRNGLLVPVQLRDGKLVAGRRVLAEGRADEALERTFNQFIELEGLVPSEVLDWIQAGAQVLIDPETSKLAAYIKEETETDPDYKHFVLGVSLTPGSEGLFIMQPCVPSCWGDPNQGPLARVLIDPASGAVYLRVDDFPALPTSAQIHTLLHDPVYAGLFAERLRDPGQSWPTKAVPLQWPVIDQFVIDLKARVAHDITGEGESALAGLFALAFVTMPHLLPPGWTTVILTLGALLMPTSIPSVQKARRKLATAA